MIDPRPALAMLLLAVCTTAGAADPPTLSPATSMDEAGMVDIRTLDHIVVGSEGCVSLAERGYL